jgi:hypothetical protein
VAAAEVHQPMALPSYTMPLNSVECIVDCPDGSPGTASAE